MRRYHEGCTETIHEARNVGQGARTSVGCSKLGNLNRGQSYSGIVALEQHNPARRMCTKAEAIEERYGTICMNVQLFGR